MSEKDVGSVFFLQKSILLQIQCQLVSGIKGEWKVSMAVYNEKQAMYSITATAKEQHQFQTAAKVFWTY